MMTNPHILSLLRQIEDLHPDSINLGLDRVVALLEKLGNPQEKLPPIVHVAGTNGKGSTLSFLQAILERANLTVHRYTSPHLWRFNERYILAGEEVRDDQLIDTLKYVQRLNAGDPITFFEITTAVAFTLFCQTPADIVLLETGLGGRLDASNVISKPLLSIITSISKDHEAFLGDTEAKIAREKAGIMRKGCPVIIAKQHNREAKEVLVQCASEVGAVLFAHGVQWDYTPTKLGFMVNNGGKTLELPAPNLRGAHQYENASSAVIASMLLEEHGMSIGKKAIQDGVCNAVHKGRFQHLTTGVAQLLPKCRVYLDGGHNPSAGLAINNILKDMGAKDITCVLAMSQNKDVKSFIECIKDKIAKVYLVPLDDNVISEVPRQKVAVLQKTCTACGIKTVIPCNSLKDAVVRIQRSDKGMVLFTGSLYLVGEVLAFNQ